MSRRAWVWVAVILSWVVAALLIAVPGWRWEDILEPVVLIAAIVVVPFLVGMAFIAPLSIARRLARYWWASIPTGRRKVQIQILEIMAVQIIVLPVMALLTGWTDRLHELDAGVRVFIAFCATAYLAAGTMAGWVYARYESKGTLPRAWNSAGMMLSGAFLTCAWPTAVIGVLGVF